MKSSLDKNYISCQTIALLFFFWALTQVIIVDSGTAIAKKPQTISMENAKEFKMTMEKTQTETITHAHPGIPDIDYKLNEQLKNMKVQKGARYKPRTKHLDKNGWALYTNRLFLESSPYLLQHAHNPVNWYPWGDTAFKTAKEKGLPILLSIGYSTCHWCHVMEEESFEDIEIATYFPARDGDRGVSIGFLTLLQRIKESYVQKPDLIHKTSMDLTNNLQKMLVPVRSIAWQ